MYGFSSVFSAVLGEGTRKVKRFVHCHTGDTWQGKGVSPGLAEGMGVHRRGESDPPHALSAMHTFTHSESKPARGALTVPQAAARSLHTPRLTQTWTQAVMVATHADGSGTCVDTGALTHLTLIHSPTESQTRVLSRRRPPSDSRVSICCGHVMTPRVRIYGRLMGRLKSPEELP